MRYTPRLAWPLLLFALCMVFKLPAQRPDETRFLVSQHVPTGWYSLESPQFQIQYHGANEVLATLAAHYAEDAYYQLRRLIEYRTETRYQILVYASPVDYINAQYNQYDAPDLSFNLNRISVYFNGSQKDFYNEIRKKLTAAMLNELFYGGTLASSVQSKLLLHLPDWYLTGASLLLGEGWTPEDEAYMRSLDKERGSFAEKVLIEDRVDRYPILKKSIWYFILNTYGRTKLVEVMYMTRLSRSVQAGINRVLGLSMQSFTLKWVDFVRTEFVTDRPSFDESSVLDFKPPAGARITSIDASPDGNAVAFYQERDGIYQLKVYNFETGAIINTPVTFGKYSDFDAYRHIDFPLSWSPDGKTIVTTLLENGLLKLVYYDLAEKKLEKFSLQGQLDWVSSLSWGAAKKLVLVAGVVNGQSDLFLTKPFSSSFTLITRSLYDELNPSWSPDGERIFFASNAGDSVYAAINKINYAQSRAGYDLYYLPYDFKGAKPTRITFTPYGDERNLKLIGTTLYYVTTENGLQNLASLDLSANNLEVSYLTNYETGISDFGNANTGRFLLRSLAEGRSRFYLVDRTTLRPLDFILKTRQASIEYQVFLKQLMENAPKSAQTDTTTSGGQSPEAPKDTATQRSNRRFYVFDEEDPDTTGPTRTVGERNETVYQQRQGSRPFDINEVPVGRKQKYKFGLDLRLIENVRFEVDPILRDNFTAELELTDNRLYNRIRAGGRVYFSLFSNVRTGTSNDWWIDYQLLRYRVQLEAGVKKQTTDLEYYGVFSSSNLAFIEGRFIQFFDEATGVDVLASQPPFYHRFTRYSSYLGLAYPINRYQKVSLRGLYLNATRVDQYDPEGYLLSALVPDKETTHFVGAQASYTFDNTNYLQEYPIRGIYGNLTLESYFTQDYNGPVYPELRLAFRTYTPLVKDIVVALRGQVGVSPATLESNYYRRYAVGGIDNWIAREGADIAFSARPEGYHFLNIVGGVRGFPYGKRTGRNYGIVNGEVRFPLRRIFNIGLNTRYLHNIVLVAFGDAGLAWDEGNPLKKNSISRQRTVSQGLPAFLVTVNDYKTPLIYSLGSGLRLPFLGYDMRLDVAWPFDDGERLPTQFIFSLGKVF